MKVRFKTIKEDYRETGPVLYLIIVVIFVICLIKWVGN
jgi:hypothetical protein